MPPPYRINPASEGMCLTDGTYVDGEGYIVGTADSAYSGTDPYATSSYGAGLSPVEGLDFMTGGNRRHNLEIDQMVTRRALEILAERGIGVDSASVRRFVHDELRHYKLNDGGRRNGNVSHADFEEILDHTVNHFGGVTGFGDNAGRIVATSADMHWRIEEMIERELLKPENAGLAADAGLRERLRTGLRSEFSALLLNEWGMESLEELGDFFRDGVVRDFEERAEMFLSGQISESRPRQAAVPVTVVRTGWEEVLTDRVNDRAIHEALQRADRGLADYYRAHLSSSLQPIETMGDLVRRISLLQPRVLESALRAATSDGRSLSQARERAIFELVASAAEASRSWRLEDATAGPRMIAAFEADVRRAERSPIERRAEEMTRSEREERERRETRTRAHRSMH